MFRSKSYEEAAAPKSNSNNNISEKLDRHHFRLHSSFNIRNLFDEQWQI